MYSLSVGYLWKNFFFFAFTLTLKCTHREIDTHEDFLSFFFYSKGDAAYKNNNAFICFVYERESLKLNNDLMFMHPVVVQTFLVHF